MIILFSYSGIVHSTTALGHCEVEWMIVSYAGDSYATKQSCALFDHEAWTVGIFRNGQCFICPADKYTSADKGSSISGNYTWTSDCGTLGKWSGTLSIGPISADGTFSGSFGASSGGGTMSNGHASRGYIEFDRNLSGRTQKWSGTVNGSSIGMLTVTDPTGNCTVKLN